MRNIITTLLILVPLTLFSQYKSDYDVKKNSLQKLPGISSVTADKETSNDILEITMLDEGYFTIGTINGISESILDDKCDITYGHPYAKTSYPVYFVDLVPYKLADLFTGGELAPKVNGDTLKITAANSLLKIEFSIVLQENGSSLKIISSVQNVDTAEHSLGLGLVFDPALGKWGDGYAKINNEFVDIEKFYFTESITQFEIWERRTSANGIGLNLTLPDDPSAQISLLNWEFAKIFQPYILAEYVPGNLYDLTLVYNTDSLLSAGEKLEREITLQLLTPDFSTTLFTRWDMTQFLTINNGIIFPNSLTATLEIFNTTGNDITIMNIGAETPHYVSFTSQPGELIVPANSYNYKSVTANTRIVYEDKIADLALLLDGDGETLDIVSRSVFIPQTPVSEEGLLIINDSISSVNHPNIELIFSAQNEETGVLIRSLTEENIFLYENGSRITEFEIAKFSGGGSNLVDVVFVLDVSGSMGNEIDAVRTNLNEFGQSLADNGYDYKVGVVTFSTNIDNVWDLTADLEQVKQNLASISLWGGVEDSPLALYRASELSFRNGSRRTIIWVTDEAYPEHSYTKQQVVNRMLEMGTTVHGIGLTTLQTEWFEPILVGTGGNFYDINGNFRDILLDVSNFESEDRYLLTYESYNNLGEYTVELQIRYAGLGGNKTFQYMLTPPEVPSKKLAYFPNPFNPSITFNVDLQNYNSGSISIYNILGQLVKEIQLTEHSTNAVTWNAVNNFGQLVSAGFYLVQLSLLDSKNNKYSETAKILYLK
jgi:hypothetical protein